MKTRERRLLRAQRRLINILDQRTGREKRILRRTVSAIERIVLLERAGNRAKKQRERR